MQQNRLQIKISLRSFDNHRSNRYNLSWEILSLRYWSHVFTATTDGTQAKNFCQSVQKLCRGKERVANKRKGNCKAFGVNANTKRKTMLNFLPRIYGYLDTRKTVFNTTEIW